MLDPAVYARDLKPDMTADSISVARIALFSLLFVYNAGGSLMRTIAWWSSSGT